MLKVRTGFRGLHDLIEASIWLTGVVALSFISAALGVWMWTA
jgi:hypothetical protein